MAESKREQLLAHHEMQLEELQKQVEALGPKIVYTKPPASFKEESSQEDAQPSSLNATNLNSESNSTQTANLPSFSQFSYHSNSSGSSFLAVKMNNNIFKSLSKFKEIYLDDMVIDQMHFGTYIRLTTIATPGKANAIFTIVEDSKKKVERIYLYNLVKEDDLVVDASHWLPVGTKILLLNPIYKIGLDSIPLLRCDNSEEVIIEEYPGETGYRKPIILKGPNDLERESPDATSEADLCRKRGNDFFLQAQFTKAIAEYTKGLELETKDEALYNNRAAAYIKLEKYEEALKDARNALLLVPQNEKALYRKALSLFHLQRFKEAQKVILSHTKLLAARKEFGNLMREIEQLVGVYDYVHMAIESEGYRVEKRPKDDQEQKQSNLNGQVNDQDQEALSKKENQHSGEEIVEGDHPEEEQDSYQSDAGAKKNNAEVPKDDLNAEKGKYEIQENKIKDDETKPTDRKTKKKKQLRDILEVIDGYVESELIDDEIDPKVAFFTSHADYIGPVAIQRINRKGRGLVASLDIAPGTLLIATKAFAHASFREIPKDQKAIECLPELRAQILHALADRMLVGKVVKKIKQEPNSAEDFYNLFTGPFRIEEVEQDQQNIGKKLPPKREDEEDEESHSIDLDKIQKIIKYNSLNSIPQVNNKLNLQKELGELDQLSGSLFERCGRGIWILPSFINHSCVPNAHHYFIGEFMFVRATANIPAGTEITIRYTEPNTKLSVRETIFQKHEFRCRCQLCNEERSEPLEVQATKRKLWDTFLEMTEKGSFTQEGLQALVDKLSDEGLNKWQKHNMELSSIALYYAGFLCHEGEFGKAMEMYELFYQHAIPNYGNQELTVLCEIIAMATGAEMGLEEVQKWMGRLKMALENGYGEADPNLLELLLFRQGRRSLNPLF